MTAVSYTRNIQLCFKLHVVTLILRLKYILIIYTNSSGLHLDFVNICLIIFQKSSNHCQINLIVDLTCQSANLPTPPCLPQNTCLYYSCMYIMVYSGPRLACTCKSPSNRTLTQLRTTVYMYKYNHSDKCQPKQGNVNQCLQLQIQVCVAFSSRALSIWCLLTNFPQSHNLGGLLATTGQKRSGSLSAGILALAIYCSSIQMRQVVLLVLAIWLLRKGQTTSYP